MSAPASMPVTLIAWRPLTKGTLLGFATVRLGKSLIIRDCPVHNALANDGVRCWVALPGKAQIDRNGQTLKDARGKTKYVAVLEWADRETADRFGDAVIAAIEAKHPGALRAVANDACDPERAA